MHYHKFRRWLLKGRKRRIVVQTFNRNISETIETEYWNLVLLLTFTICTYDTNLNEIWKGGFQACPTFTWNFPTINYIYYCSLRISHLPQFRIFIKIQHFWDGKWDFNHCPHVVIRRDTFFSCKPFVTVHFPN